VFTATWVVVVQANVSVDNTLYLRDDCSSFIMFQHWAL